ncbi:MAG: hypothetical protein WAT44_00455 [Microgenomates group bacterium]
MEKIRKFIPEVLFFAYVLLLNTYKLFSSSNFNPDMGRDMMWIWDILHGTFTLLGPKLSFGGYYLGPYYYYIFAPFVYLTQNWPYGLVASNAVFSAILTTTIFYVLRKNHGTVFAGLGSVWISITPYFLFSARNPGNAYSYIAALFLQSILFLYLKKNRAFYVYMGLMSGLILNFHPASVFLLAPFFLASFTKVKPKEVLIRFGLFCLAAAMLFSPLVFFELRHNFIMFTNTFITKSYSAFLSANSPASMMKASPNYLISFFQIDNFLSKWLTPTVTVLLFLSAATAFISKDVKAKRATYLLISVVVIFNLALRYQVAFHYAFPLLIGVQSLFIYVIGRVKARFWYPTLMVIVIWSLLLFPKSNYADAYRPFERLYANTSIAVKKMPLDSSSISVAYFAHNPMATLGYEYRYILKLLGHKVMGEQEYSISERLLVVSEEGELDFRSLKTWELDQFGPKEMISSNSAGETIFYLFKKSDK